MWFINFLIDSTVVFDKDKVSFYTDIKKLSIDSTELFDKDKVSFYTDIKRLSVWFIKYLNKYRSLYPEIKINPLYMVS